jgi:hypothetical protein
MVASAAVRLRRSRCGVIAEVVGSLLRLIRRSARPHGAVPGRLVPWTAADRGVRPVHVPLVRPTGS